MCVNKAGHKIPRIYRPVNNKNYYLQFSIKDLTTLIMFVIKDNSLFMRKFRHDFKTHLSGHFQRLIEMMIPCGVVFSKVTLISIGYYDYPRNKPIY